MKNLRIKSKLIISFVLVAIFAAISGGFGIIGLNALNVNEEGMYDQGTVAYDATVLWQNMQAQRVAYRGAALKHFIDMEYEGELTTLTALDTEFTNLMSSLQARVTLQESKTQLAAAVTAYDKYSEYRDSFVTALRSGREAEMSQILVDIAAPIDTVVSNLQSVSEAAMAQMDSTNIADSRTATVLIVIMAVLVVVAVASAVFFALYISGLISKPLIVLTAFMNKAGKTGDISLRPEDMETIGKYAQNKDETGQCIASTSNFIKHLSGIGSSLETVADGDLTIDVNLLSEKDTMGLSLKKMADGLNNMFSEINSATAQVSIGSKQIADGAQSLAQGSTEQASSIQELSASISEIAEMTKQNARIAKEASDLSVAIRGSAEKGNSQMEHMMQAVIEITDASSKIEKVIGVIDNIAFQTNILALNAAVEAARAGSAGKGFAVVAEEVRSLAAKSADAASSTGELIKNSIDKAKLGLDIATETSESLKEIVEGIKQSTEIVSKIARSSDEQAGSIVQINTGIDQVAQVVQQNSATAQESAAASEEMNGQADMLENLITQFKLRDSGGSRHKNLPGTGGSSQKSISKSSSAYDSGKENYGKY